MRINNSLKNIMSSLIGQVVGLLISFISRMIFIKYLGFEYLGVNGLFTNILSLLSLAEMGIGSSIIYSLYKPLATNDKDKIIELMNFYAIAYKIIGVLIFVMGIGVIPFLDYIIKDKPNVDYLNIVYFLFLINTVSSYFFAYKRSLIIADQKKYVTTIYRYVFYIILNIVQMIILILTKNYRLFLVAQIITTILENILISFKANKMYPFLKNHKKERLDISTKNEIFKNVKAMMMHKIGGVIVNGTDNILISSFAGVMWVGLYSNYYLIINALNIMISQIFNSFTASIGNLYVSASKKKSYEIYKYILFLNFWIGGFCTISLYILINPFISLWIGSDFLLEESLVIIIVINFYIQIMRQSTLAYRTSLGLFWHDRYKPLFESVINISVSIILAKNIGIAGVLIGTFISTISTAFWVEPYILYRYGFNISVKSYFKKYINNILLTILSGIITYKISNIVSELSWINLIHKLIICVTVPNIIFIIFYYKSDEFLYYKNILKSFYLKLKDKLKLKKIL